MGYIEREVVIVLHVASEVVIMDFMGFYLIWAIVLEANIER